MTGSARRLVQPGAEAYAPAIRVSVGGRALSDAVLQDVQELRVTLQRDELAGFSIVLANVDPGKGGLSRAQEVTAFKYSDSTLLDVGGSIVVEMGYAGQLRTMLVGDITTLSPSFPESGLPTIAITAARASACSVLSSSSVTSAPVRRLISIARKAEAGDRPTAYRMSR